MGRSTYYIIYRLAGDAFNYSRYIEAFDHKEARAKLKTEEKNLQKIIKIELAD
jgi:hypothetical protein